MATATEAMRGPIEGTVATLRQKTAPAAERAARAAHGAGQPALLAELGGAR